MEKKIVILDSGIANLGSVANAFKKLNISTEVTCSPQVIRKASGLIFPGVGSFGHASRELSKQGLDLVVKDFLALGRPFLGICLGMQLLLEGSEEDAGEKGGSSGGLGVVPGRVIRFEEGLPVPHVGWNQVSPRISHPLFKGISSGTYFYFTHSYYVAPKLAEHTMSVTDYGVTFASAICRNNIMGVQFHPEKSGPGGLRLLSNFGIMVNHW